MRIQSSMELKRTPFSGAGDEPALPDLLADPILQLLMRRDRLAEDELNKVIEHGRQALRRRPAA